MRITRLPKSTLDFDPQCLAHAATGERDECDQRIAAFGQGASWWSRSVCPRGFEERSRLPGLAPLIQRRRFRWFYDAADRVWSVIDTVAVSRCEQAAERLQVLPLCGSGGDLDPLLAALEDGILLWGLRISGGISCQPKHLSRARSYRGTEVILM